MKAKFALTAMEMRHPLWLKLSAHMKDRLENLRAQNDHAAPLDDALQTAARRGRITQLKELIALASKPKALEEE
jgi:hypothetical protein